MKIGPSVLLVPEANEDYEDNEDSVNMETNAFHINRIINMLIKNTMIKQEWQKNT
jgi:hypothetical protein